MPARGTAPAIFIRCGCGVPDEHYVENKSHLYGISICSCAADFQMLVGGSHCEHFTLRWGGGSLIEETVL